MPYILKLHETENAENETESDISINGSTNWSGKMKAKVVLCLLVGHKTVEHSGGWSGHCERCGLHIQDTPAGYYTYWPKEYNKQEQDYKWLNELEW